LGHVHLLLSPGGFTFLYLRPPSTSPSMPRCFCTARRDSRLCLDAGAALGNNNQVIVLGVDATPINMLLKRLPCAPIVLAASTSTALCASIVVGSPIYSLATALAMNDVITTSQRCIRTHYCNIHYLIRFFRLLYQFFWNPSEGYKLVYSTLHDENTLFLLAFSLFRPS